MMVTGIDEGSPGVKSKVMSMQEGGGDITANDYRFSVEQRGRDYGTPGVIQFRIITGDASSDDSIADAPRFLPSGGMSDGQWYFWKMAWATGWARVTVREGGENGRIIWDWTVHTNGHPYRPVPHVIHIGAPVGRAGPANATIAGMIVKNLWVSANPRPTFPSAR
jgi:hypothetical protein